MRNKDWQMVNGFYGTGTPCKVYIYKGWYAIEGSTNVNFTYEEITPGRNVENILDIDTFQATAPIEDEDDLIKEVENWENS